MYKKSIIAAALAMASVSALADNYYVVVPVKGRVASSDSVSVTLSGGSLPAGRVGTPYVGADLKTLLSVTGDAAYTGYGVKWNVISGSLPAGLVLNSNGTVSGTPTAGGTASFQVKASYKTKSGQQAYQIVVTSVTVALAAGTPPEAVVGLPYKYDIKPLLSVTGADGYSGTGVTWSVVASTLPAGLQLLQDGTISGTPTEAGTGAVTARATYQGSQGEQGYQVVSLDIKVSLEQASLPEAKVGIPYVGYDFKSQLKVDGDANLDSSKVTFQATSLPAGLELSTTGTLTGTPTAPTADTGVNVTVKATYKAKSGETVYVFKVGNTIFEATSIASGGSHTCAVTPTGGVKCWGNNTYGQLGGGSSPSQFPKDVAALPSGIVSVVAGLNYNCAMTTAGGVKCWGHNSNGQLAVAPAGGVPIKTPVDVPNLAGVKSIAAGNYHACAVTASGGAKCWGAGSYYQLGTGTTADSTTPVDVPGLTSGVAAVGAGSESSCALTTAGAVYCWGSNGYGQLGTGNSTTAKSPTPVVSLSSGVTSLAVGAYHACAVVAGTVKCWGTNFGGALGNNSGNNTISFSPVQVSGLSNAVSVSIRDTRTCAITATGGLKCWGTNTYGTMGNGNTTDAFTPVDVVGLSSGVRAVAMGGNHICAILNSGPAKCWGNGADGRLGNRSTTSSSLPVDVLR